MHQLTVILGDDNYDLAGYWDKGKGGKRWIYYRTGSASHNVPLINNQNQNELAKVKFVKFESKKSSAFAVIDLTDAYEEFAANVTRGLAIIGNRRAVVVQDEFKLKKPCEIAWAMTTDADIKISRNNVAELNLDGEKLVAKLISPANAGFSVESAEQKPPQKSNEGTNRLMIRLPDAKGNVRIAVLLSPVWPDGKGVKKVKLEPLEKWK